MSAAARARLRELIEARRIATIPGTPNALCAQVAAQVGFEAVYLSGGATTTGAFGVPDIGLLSATEMAQQVRLLAAATPLPVVADADTGYGNALDVHRTVREYEHAGVAGFHLEDQISPKRCGHLAGKECIPIDEMLTKIRAARAARIDPNLVVIARTDARSPLGLEAAIERGIAYAEAGADMIFPEAMDSREEFEAYAAAVDAPLLANMTEFGRGPMLSAGELEEIGYAAVIFPVSALRVAMAAVRDFYRDLHRDGTQAAWVERMLTRADLYELVDYAGYDALEQTFLTGDDD